MNAHKMNHMNAQKTNHMSGHKTNPTNAQHMNSANAHLVQMKNKLNVQKYAKDNNSLVSSPSTSQSQWKILSKLVPCPQTPQSSLKPPPRPALEVSANSDGFKLKWYFNGALTEYVLKKEFAAIQKYQIYMCVVDQQVSINISKNW